MSPLAVTQYFKEAWAEIKKVSWPTKHQTQQYTWLVIGISVVVAAYLGALDYVFNWLLTLVIQ